MIRSSLFIATLAVVSANAASNAKDPMVQLAKIEKSATVKDGAINVKAIREASANLVTTYDLNRETLIVGLNKKGAKTEEVIAKMDANVEALNYATTKQADETIRSQSVRIQNLVGTIRQDLYELDQLTK